MTQHIMKNSISLTVEAIGVESCKLDIQLKLKKWNIELRF